MKKIFALILMAFTMMACLFAYEPKKECVEVKINSDVVYYENTEPYDYYGVKPGPKAQGWDGWKASHNYVEWVIRKDYTVENLVDYEYERLSSFRNSYLKCILAAINLDVSDAYIAYIAHKAYMDFYNKMNGTNMTPEDYYTESLRKRAEYQKRTAILSVPFVTEENWLYISKTEMFCKMRDFIEEVRTDK